MTDPHDQRCIALLRDDVAELRRERNLYRLLYLAALDGLSLVATAGERYEQIQRDLRKERETQMAAAMAQHTRDYAWFLERAR